MDSNIEMNNKNVVFFSPHGSIWQHSFPESILADHLKKLGMNIDYVGCKDILSKQCTTMWMYENKDHLNNLDKKKICENCVRDQKKITNNFKYNYSTLEDFVSSEDLKTIDQILEFLKKKDVHEISKYSYEGIRLGKFALYETVLAYKKLDLKFNSNEKKKYLLDLRGCLISLFAFKKILEKKNYYGVFLYNSNYAKNRTVKFFAEKLGIKVFSIHAGSNVHNRLQRLMITLKEHTYHDFYLKEKIWEIYKKVKLTKDIIQDVINHFQSLFKAQNVFVYSSPANKNINVRNYFNIDKHKKIILAILSSPDERGAAGMIGSKTSTQKVFKDVYEWINFLIKNFSSREDVVLIIRPHPREFPNKREKILSNNLIKLSYLFSKIKNNKNIIINLPSDNVSIYNIIPYCDTVLTMGSTSTIETTLLGIPCVSMSENFLSFPKDITIVALNKKKYLKAIYYSLNKKLDLNLAKKTFRWLALKQYYSTLNLSNLFNFSETGFFFKIFWKFFNNSFKNYYIIKYKISCNYSMCKDLKYFFNSNQIAFINNNLPVKKILTKDEDLLLKKAIKKILELSFFDKSLPSKLINF